MAKKKFKIPMKGDSPVSAVSTVSVDNCSGCMKPATKNWVILGDGRTVHLGGLYGLKCFNVVNGFSDEEEEEAY